MPMLQVETRADQAAAASDTLTLFYDERKKSRLRARTDTGQDIAIVLPRGSALRDGDLLRANTGEVLRVRAGGELVSEARAQDPVLLARAAYHLGNRHVPLQIEEGVVRYQHDHVLDGMLRELGLVVSTRRAAFEPESGAYSHSHSHSHAAAPEPEQAP